MTDNAMLMIMTVMESLHLCEHYVEKI